ncbi:asparagine synthase-related protein [Metabacillus herbersteinensis]|uniref:asparagine synthase (glutamine-hydrolyzing) n=1 Tax=Metabacillus herbersteinensis TaxID=283816 RepID=A0ABV6GF17_9BACI
MTKVNLSYNNGFMWKNFKGVSFKGYFFDNTNPNLYFNINESSEFGLQFEQKLPHLNGFFSVIYEKDGILFASVDRLRSIPLFYCKTSDDFLISDNLSWIKEQIGDEQIDDVSSEEFLLTGYVTGTDTLYPKIKQLQAGESLKYSSNSHNLEVESYFELRHQEPSQFSSEELIRELDTIHISVFKNLIKTFKGRQVVIPLSGGYDSRLIAVMLKRLNYKNIICFTYGKPDNAEARISKQVADELGFKWCFVPYNETKWKKCYESKEYNQYVDFASNFSSLAHIQDFLAVKELKKLKIINDDAIFVPGHAYDFLAGSHIPANFVKSVQLSDNDLLKTIINKHYNLWRWDRSKREINKKLVLKLKKQIGSKLYSNNAEVADDLEKWDWQERQAKFICNSVRVYEYFGYEWRLPLWDNDLISFWSKIPMQLRINRGLFFKYVEEKQQFNAIEKNKKSIKTINILKNKIPKSVYLEMYRIKSILYDEQGWFGIYSTKMKLRYFVKKGSSVNSVLTLEFLKKWYSVPVTTRNMSKDNKKS